MRTRHRSDVAPAGPVVLPDTGLGRGWESAALTGATLLVVCFGLVSLYSASSVMAQRQSLPDTYYLLQQALGALVGLGVLAGAVLVPYHVWRAAAWPLLIVTWVMLVVVVLPWTTGIAPETNGARRWLRIGGVGFQPSELAKFAIIAWTAMLATRKQEHFGSLRRGLMPFLVVWAALLIPILLQPNFSTAALVGLLGAVVVFAAGARIVHFVFLGLLAFPLLWAQMGVGFRARRMAVFLDPLSDPDGAGFQVRQSLIALGSGGVTGTGFGEGRQRFGFLPEPHNDFIFAMIGEEWGLVGVLLLVSLYVTIVAVGFRVARRAPDLFGQLLATGLASFVALQAFLHMAVGLGMVPATGVPLPLVSYGRSSLLVTLLSVGVILSIARAAEGPLPAGARGWGRGRR